MQASTGHLRVAVVGSRHIARPGLILHPILEWARPFIACIISGSSSDPARRMAGGNVDCWARDWARARWEIDFHGFAPDYHRYGAQLAPKVRNGQIAAACDVLIALWDGASAGTLDVMTRARVIHQRPIILIRHPAPLEAVRFEEVAVECDPALPVLRTDNAASGD